MNTTSSEQPFDYAKSNIMTATIATHGKEALFPVPDDLAPQIDHGDLTFPLRTYLGDPDYQSAINSFLEDYFQCVLQLQSKMSLIEAAYRTQCLVCGTRPLKTRQLIAFLDAVSIAAELHLRRLISPSSPMQVMEIPAKRKQEIQSTTNFLASQDTWVADSSELQLPNPISDLTIAAAQRNPESVRRKLLALADLERRSPEDARWVRFIELTGSSTEELVRYFGSLELTQQMIEMRVNMATAKIK